MYIHSLVWTLLYTYYDFTLSHEWEPLLKNHSVFLNEIKRKTRINTESREKGTKRKRTSTYWKKISFQVLSICVFVECLFGWIFLYLLLHCIILLYLCPTCFPQISLLFSLSFSIFTSHSKVRDDFFSLAITRAGTRCSIQVKLWILPTQLDTWTMII